MHLGEKSHDVYPQKIVLNPRASKAIELLVPDINPFVFVDMVYSV
jgi:hypothetical protein